MTKILPYLFIGDVYAGKNKEKLTEAGITHIVNLVSEDVRLLLRPCVLHSRVVVCRIRLNDAAFFCYCVLAPPQVDNFYPDSYTYFEVPGEAAIDYPIDDWFEKVAKFIFEAKDKEGSKVIRI